MSPFAPDDAPNMYDPGASLNPTLNDNLLSLTSFSVCAYTCPLAVPVCVLVVTALIVAVCAVTVLRIVFEDAVNGIPFDVSTVKKPLEY